MVEIKPFDFESFDFIEESNDSLQRTEEWHKKRSGCFTGSNNKKLMGCGRSTGSKSWIEYPAKVYDFGVTAEKYIFAVGKERLTGNRSMEVKAKPLQHGIDNEPLLIQQLLNDGIITDFVEKGFEKFPNYENGGASVDGIAKAGPNIPKRLGLKVDEEIVLELKCCVSWDGNYARMYEPVTEKHDDFWQFQSEMLAVGVKKTLYVATNPMTVKDYDCEICEASPIHQQYLLKRCKIADKAIELWGKYKYSKALAVAIAEFKEEG